MEKGFIFPERGGSLWPSVNAYQDDALQELNKIIITCASEPIHHLLNICTCIDGRYGRRWFGDFMRWNRMKGSVKVMVSLANETIHGFFGFVVHFDHFRGVWCRATRNCPGGSEKVVMTCASEDIHPLLGIVRYLDEAPAVR